MLKTSLVITGDASVAKREVKDLTAAVTDAAAASRAAAPAAAQLDTAQKQVAASAKTEKAAIAEANAEIANAAQGARQAATANAAIVASNAAVTQSAGRSTKAVNDNDAANRRHAQGVRQMGQQVGDMAVMIQGGIDPMRAFATQAGQMGYALSEMGGTAGKVGAFLTGPWGIALTVAVTMGAPFLSMLWETDTAARQAELATSGLSSAETMLGDVFGKTSSRIAEQNELLRINARLKAINLRADAEAAEKDAGKTFRTAGYNTGNTVLTAVGAISGFNGGAIADLLGFNNNRGVQQLATRARSIDGMRARAGETSAQLSARRGQAFDQLLQQAEGTNFDGSGVDKPAFLEAVSKSAAARANRRIADLIDESLDAGRINPLLTKPGSTKKPPKPKSTAARDEFGLDAVDKIAGITDRFSDMPPVVRQVNQATRELDDLIRNLERRKPPAFEATIASAREAKVAIEAGLNKPFDDYLEQQAQALEFGELAAQGRTIEIEALKAILQIERQRGPLSQEQRDAILGSAAGLKQQERQLERINALQNVNLGALQDMQGIIKQSIYEGPESLADLPGRLLDSFKRFQAELISEQVFGELFRDMRDQVLGANKVDQASNTIVTAFNNAANSADALSSSLAQAAGVDGPDITVEGKRQQPEKRTSADVYANTISGVLKKIGVGPDAAATIGKFAGKGLQGAFEGQMAAGVAGMLGIKTSSAGSAVGGAIGSFLPIPGGSIVGGLLGGVLGGLFQKPKAGTASLTSNDTAATLSGNSASVKAAASGTAGAVQQGIAQIAEQLGGELGKYAVSIGTFDGKYRVSTTGFGGQLDSKTARGQGLKDFGKDGEGAAIAYAIQDAIADGAIQGISDAVSRALRSSTDVDKALKEALKVQEVELIAGGIAAEYAKAFADMERQAKERVRIASQYGFDVVAIEKRNAEDRAKLTDQLLKAQVGSLQSLVDEMTSGSLFEGTAMEQIEAVNAKIAKARTDLDAGVAGAGDTLAGLLQQRLELSKSAYGTTGAYAADRTATLNEANAAIARANAQIAEANKSDPALAATNAALDENNDQNAQMLSALRLSNELLQRLTAGLGGGGGGPTNAPRV
jgi:hypothetical protein